MLTRASLSIAVSLALAGCAAPPLNPAVSTDHPANPNAAEAPMQPPSPTLAAGPSAELAPPTSGSMPGMQHAGHDMGGMKHDQNGMQHGGGGMKGMDHDMPGMMPDVPSSQPPTTQAAVLYTCTMHPEVLSNKPGKCPKCGMKLVVKKDAKGSEQRGHE
jgi:hypothetical protein